jgi:isopropylmalate/homocitrate/citramalate synthase
MIIEVGPRDGLQNESGQIPTDLKLAFIANLAATGLREIEVTSFVSPTRVPQMADADELWPRLPAGPDYSALAPNLRGLTRALSLGVSRVAFFTGASDAFTTANIGMSVNQSLTAFGEMMDHIRGNAPSTRVRAYVSVAFECPFSGRVAPGQTAALARQLLKIGAHEVAFGDTIGVATPNEVLELAKALRRSRIPDAAVAWHFHDTNGTAVANAVQAVQCGYRRLDSSAGGLGGCPFAPGAGGNLATEDLVYTLDRLGLATGVDLEKLARASLPILRHLGRVPESKVQRRVLGRARASAE